MIRYSYLLKIGIDLIKTLPDWQLLLDRLYFGSRCASTLIFQMWLDREDEAPVARAARKPGAGERAAAAGSII